LTVATNGLYVTAGGVSVAGSGMKITGGLTVSNVGLSVTAGGATVSSGGLSVTDGLTVNSAGIKVTAGGLEVTGGITVGSGGILVTGGLTVYGGVYYDTITVNSGSDIRLKTDIIKVDQSLSKISKMRGVYFSWVKDEPNGLKFDEKRHLGVIAQEIQEVLPEIVEEIHGGKYLGVRYQEIIPVLIEGIKELSSSINVCSAPRENQDVESSDLLDVFSISEEIVKLRKADEVLLLADNSHLAKREQLFAANRELLRKYESLLLKNQELEEKIVMLEDILESKLKATAPYNSSQNI